ncbi:MAG: ATP-binding protein [Syntrophobacteraceae bacterium]|nr:ATP-binding protein [Syntrophobacteraceae bacterium]
MKYPAPLRFKMPSTLAAVDESCLGVKTWLQDNGLENDWFAVLLLLRESLNNAVIHGNRNDPVLDVDCELRRGRRWLSISVADSGAGFSWARAKKHRACCRDTCGRGLEIYQLYADEVVFNRRGNRVLLRRQLRKGGECALNSNRAK